MKLLKPKKFNKTIAKRKLDTLFSLKVRSIGICQLAGTDTIHCGGVLQCCHLIGRGNLFLRWHEWNAISGCAGHHVYYTYHPEAWREQIMKLYPLEYQWLLDNREQKITFNESYFQEKLKELNQSV